MQENFLKKLIKSKNDPYAPRIENLKDFMDVALYENFLKKLYGKEFYELYSYNKKMCDLYWMVENRALDVMRRIYKERRELVFEPFGPVSSCKKYFDLICNEVKKEGDSLLLLYCLLKRSIALYFL